MIIWFLIINNPYSVVKLKKVCGKFKYYAWFSDLQSLTLALSEQIILSAFSLESIFEALIKSKKPATFTTLSNLDNEYLSFILANCLFFANLCESLADLKYSDPLSLCSNIPINTLKALTDNNINAHLLMECFKKLGYEHPLQTYFDLEEPVRQLFLDNTYAVTEIMTALNKKTQTLQYLNSLGINAMITIFSSHYEYISRIKRGVNLEQEFAPKLNSANEFKPALKEFIQSIKAEQSNSQRLLRSTLTTEDIKNYLDEKTGYLVDIPVTLDGDLFDLETLTSLPADARGYRLHPKSNEKFLLSEIQPAKRLYENLNKLLEENQRNACLNP